MYAAANPTLRRAIAKSDVFNQFALRKNDTVAPFSIMGEYNGIKTTKGVWFVYECEHAVERCMQREAECGYEEDDLHITVANQLDSVFSSYLPTKDEFRMVHGDAEYQRLQIRDMCNDSVSCILIVDQNTKEVLVVTVLTPTEEHLVNRKNLFVAEISEKSSLPEGVVQLKLYDNRRWNGEFLTETFCDDTSWL